MGGAAPYWHQYSYDTLGRRTKLVRNAVGAQTTKAQTTYAYSAHRLTSTTSTAGVTTYVYDSVGNRTSMQTPSGATTYSWDAEGELRGVQGASGSSVSSVYDASGERLTRTDASGTTVYLPGGQEFTVAASGKVSVARLYSFAGSTVAIRTGRGLAGVSSLVCDPHGTPLASVPNAERGEGKVVKAYTDPFGGSRDGSLLTLASDRQFLGKTRDQASGLTLLGARYYDEATGTFVSVDPQLDPQQPAQFHAYVYSGNNPMTWSDPSGLWWNPIKAVAKAAKSVGSWAKRNQAEIIGAVAGTVVFAGCMAGSFGLGSVGCGVAAGAVGGAVTQAWKTDVQHTERFSWGSLATATVFGGISGFAGGVLGEAASTFIAPVAKTAVAAVANSVRSVTSKAASSASGAARAIGTGAKAVAKRATGAASRADEAADMDSFLASGSTVRHTGTATAIGGDQATLSNLARSRGADGMHDVIVHGTADGRPVVDGAVTHTRQIADAILDNPNYSSGCPIRLVMCHGGREAAADLANMLGTDVVATTRKAQLDPLTGRLLQGGF